MGLANPQKENRHITGKSSLLTLLAASLIAVQPLPSVANTVDNSIGGPARIITPLLPPTQSFRYGARKDFSIDGVSLITTLPNGDERGGVPEPSINIAARTAAVPADGDRFVIVSMINSPNGAEPVPTDRLAAACGDIDGCQIRLGIQKAGQENIDSIFSSMVQINPSTGSWTATPMSRGNATTQVTTGQDGTAGAQSLVQAHTCFLSDGEYPGLNNNIVPDNAVGFYLASFPAGQGSCVLTVID